MLEISHVTKKYRDKEALSDVSLTIPQGQIVGLLGENGAGKTTMMKCILGYLRHKGTVTLDGEAIGPGNIHRLSFAPASTPSFRPCPRWITGTSIRPISLPSTIGGSAC